MASEDVDQDAAQVIDAISAAMSADDLVRLNARSVHEELPAETIAADWLKSVAKQD